MADLVIQRCVFPSDPNLSPLYYRILDNPCLAGFPGPAPLDRRSTVLGQGARIDTNTYFNSFFEAYWRRHSRLGKLVLRLRLFGTGTIRLWRASAACGAREVGCVDFDGEDQTVEMEAPGPPAHSREVGTLFFEVVARSHSATVISADWLAINVEPKPVKLVAGYCTFEREEFILKNIRALADDPDLASYLSRIVVVDQGRRKVMSHPDYRALPGHVVSRTSFFDQANFGGAGGFTRCILEARRLQGSTHVLLLDDDAIVEPESAFRTATFFSLAKEEFAVGGAMLDLLRPTEMYEAGGFVLPWRMGVGGRGRDLSLQSPQNVLSLADPQYSHYNAWWFFACPLSIIDRLGLPLPLFVRCDDLEFGCRLMRAGIPTIALPGLAVWHLPFYLKKRGWMDYYSRRNMLVALALHFSQSRASLAAAFLGILVYRLLTLDYFRAWAVCEGMDDYLSGPSVLKENPERIHRRLLEIHRSLSPGLLPKTHCLRTAAAPAMPQSRIRQLCGMLGALVRQLVRPSPGKDILPDCVLNGKDEHWYSLRKADVVAIDEQSGESYVVLRRDRGKFLGFLARGLRSALRLLFAHGRTVRQWQSEARQLSGPRFWREYLGMKAEDAPQVDHAGL
jgi:galactofuranosylgalactofuranosylrhamnosyl-N-acetylglucosaminyl-diphospho-decaprenol beta-1,5/1,6-galactofuranosyltransferase